MNLEISLSAPAWHKGIAPPVFAGFVRGPNIAMSQRLMDDAAKPELSMSELLAKIGRLHDVADFEILFRHFAPRVKAYMARTGSAGAVAEELMQETMVAVWKKSEMYDPSRGAASTWIFTIARNLRIDAIRRERHPEFDPDDPALSNEPEPAADRKMESAQSAVAIRKALEALPPDQAEVLRLSFFEDRSQSDISQKLGLPLGTVKSRMRLAFARLRTAMTLSGDAP